MRGPSLLGPTSWLLLLLICSIVAEEIPDTKETALDEPQVGQQAAKLLPIFSVIRFPNDVCEGSSRNGTCYTTSECANKGGTESGSCAQGFGICCIFTLSCGESSSENCTYLVQSSTSTWTDSPCRYEICKCASNVCRIRYDFNTMVIAGPTLGTTAATAPNTVAGQTGDCAQDSITFTGANNGPPTICGTNTGQHLYVDASEECHLANFNIATGDSSTARQWDVKVTQYECGSEAGGPPGCLQYHTSTTGSIASFNFPTGSTIGSTATHLSNQDYSICFRRASGQCYICFVTSIAIIIAAVIGQSSFGLSISPSATIGQSAVDTECTTDYLEILDGNTIAIAATTTVTKGIYRVCGRIFNTATAIATAASVCTRRIPFQIRFHTDENEVGLATGTSTGITAEADTAPGGITGFKLNFAQGSC